MAQSVAGTLGFERRVAHRPDGLLERLANGRNRAALASPLPLVGKGDDKIDFAAPLPIGTRLGTFEVTGVIHRDSSGVVYAGEDRSLLGKIAIKEYLPATLADRMANGKVGVRSLRHKQSFQDGKQRFLSNARMLAALDEPALIRVLRCWKQHGTAYLAMPLYDGQTLNDVLRDTPRPCEAWLKSMLGPLLDALATLHRFDCYPCNVTPDNIVVLEEGTPLLFAFGAGRRTDGSAAGDLGPDVNSGFAPIEQYGRDPTMVEGPWTDIYAVAAVLHFAITGIPLPAPATRMISDTLPPLRSSHGDYSALFLDAVDRGLAVLPGDRPQTIAEFRTALGIHQIASAELPMARPAPAPAKPRTPSLTVSPLTEPGPITRVDVPEGIRAELPGDGSRVTVTVTSSPPPEQTTPTRSSPATILSSLDRAPGKLVVPLIVVGLVALGVLVWAMDEPRHAALGTVDGALAVQPVPAAVQPSPPDAAVAVPNQTVLPFSPPVAANPPAANSATQQRAVPDGATITSASARRATPTRSAPPAPPTGKIRFSIKPWGEILVDGKTRGVSPPIKELSIPEGRHRIEIRNGKFAGYQRELDVKAGSSGSISYSFKAR